MKARGFKQHSSPQFVHCWTHNRATPDLNESHFVRLAQPLRLILSRVHEIESKRMNWKERTSCFVVQCWEWLQFWHCWLSEAGRPSLMVGFIMAMADTVGMVDTGDTVGMADTADTDTGQWSWRQSLYPQCTVGMDTGVDMGRE